MLDADIYSPQGGYVFDPVSLSVNIIYKQLPVWTDFDEISILGGDLDVMSSYRFWIFCISRKPIHHRYFWLPPYCSSPTPRSYGMGGDLLSRIALHWDKNMML